LICNKNRNIKNKHQCSWKSRVYKTAGHVGEAGDKAAMPTGTPSIGAIKQLQLLLEDRKGRRAWRGRWKTQLRRCEN